jgi:hypothetical protein
LRAHGDRERDDHREEEQAIPVCIHRSSPLFSA